MTVAQALAAVMADVKAVGKDDRNQAQGFNFRGIDGVLNAVGPALRRHGVVPLPEVLEAHRSTVEVGKNRTLMREVTLRVRYRFVGPDGDHLDAVVEAEALDSGDKATSKAMSVAFRTALLQVLAIPTHEPDPDSVSYERAPAREPQPSDRVSAAQAKSELLQALGGDRARAKELWEAHQPATRGDLDELLSGVS